MKGLSHYQICIVQALAWLKSRNKKHYCYPSQDKIIKILSISYSITRCRRTLNYHLAYLEQQGYIVRVRRTHAGLDGQPAFASTLYMLRKRALALLGLMIDRLARAGLASWARVKKLVNDDETVNFARVQSLLGGIKSMPPG